MKEKNKKDLSQEEQFEDQLFDVSNLASAGDCTGLITHGIVDDEEIDNYQALYPFLPPDIGVDNDKKKDK
ncbi:MAG: hypothetical protein PHD70_08540 [Anaerostipes sp.]|jgi:hypothetical protein|nr:hypothetical protein [Anaerostipes sp.]MDD3746502.1 hypothetical protein [Anaerostipes sp.]